VGAEGAEGAEGVEVDGMSEAELLEYLRKRPDTRHAIQRRYREEVIKKNQGGSLLS